MRYDYFVDMLTPQEAGLPEGDSYGQVICADGYISFRRKSKFVLAVDLGQTADPTALCVIERIVEAKVPREIGGDLFERSGDPRYEVRHLERMPLRTSYPTW